MREQTNRLQVPDSHRRRGTGSWQRLVVDWESDGAMARRLECLDGDGLVLAFVVEASEGKMTANDSLSGGQVPKRYL